MDARWSLVLALGLIAGCAADAGDNTDTTDDDAEALDTGTTCSAGNDVDVVVYTQDGYAELAQAFADHPTPCAHYYLSLPALAEHKDMPRGGTQPAVVRNHGAQFHAMAEFHWGGWRNVTGLTAYQKGVEFRRRMDAAGYDVASGDTWAINELPSTFRTDPEVRTRALDTIRGLYDGPPGSPKVKGAVFLEGMGSTLDYMGPYKSALEDTLRDDPFFRTVEGQTKWWGQETYASPKNVCIPGGNVGLEAQHINQFTHHVSLLAAAAPGSTANPAQTYFERQYTPMLNMAAASPGYDTADMSFEAMREFVSTQVYATRAWAGTHPDQHRRIGIGWTWNREKLSEDQINVLAKRVARSIAGAYSGDGGKAARACSPSGAFTFCHCAVAGAHFNDAWSAFDNW